MDYKQKYEDALERARNIRFGNPQSGTANVVCEEIFPELKESEDEKIRKELITWLQNIEGQSLPIDRYNAAITWLEKQGEKKQGKTPIWNHWKDGIAGNEEGKLIYLIKKGNSYSLSSCLGYECDYILLSDLDKLMLQEKQGEQKPAENKGMNLVEEEMTPFQKKVFCIIDTTIEEEQGLKQVCDELLRLAHDEIMQKPAWSEEDERTLTKIQDHIREFYVDKKGYPYVAEPDSPEMMEFNWLKSLKERYTWKPSDEQMEALLKLEEMHVLEHEKNQENAHLYMVIKNIREQLQKLRKE